MLLLALLHPQSPLVQDSEAQGDEIKLSGTLVLAKSLGLFRKLISFC